MGLFTRSGGGRSRDPMDLQHQALSQLQVADHIRNGWRWLEQGAQAAEQDAARLIARMDKIRGVRADPAQRLEQMRQLSRAWAELPDPRLPTVPIGVRDYPVDRAAELAPTFPVLGTEEAARLSKLSAGDYARAVDSLTDQGRIRRGPYGPVATPEERDITANLLRHDLREAEQQLRDEVLGTAADVFPEPGDPDDWRRVPDQPGQELRTTFLRDVAATREDLFEARWADAETKESRAGDFESAQRLLQGYDQHTGRGEPGYDETTPFSRRTGPEYDTPPPGPARDVAGPGYSASSPETDLEAG